MPKQQQRGNNVIQQSFSQYKFDIRLAVKDYETRKEIVDFITLRFVEKYGWVCLYYEWDYRSHYDELFIELNCAEIYTEIMLKYA